MSGSPSSKPSDGLEHLILSFEPSAFPADLVPPAPSLRFLFRVQATLEPKWAAIGQSTNSFRAVVPITGGSLSSAPNDKLRGIPGVDGARLIKGGADFLRRTDDGVFWPTAHYAFELRSGHYIYFSTEGSRIVLPTAVDPARPQPHEMLFRLRLKLETDDPDPEIQQACKSVIIGAAVRGPDAIAIDAYAVQ
ncbi:hypothetical protein V8E36_006893 [Tilletia maclaganii]